MKSDISTEEIKKSKRRKIFIIISIIIFLFGLFVIASGITVYVYNQGNASDGYAYSNVYHVNTSAYAFTAYMNPYTTSTWGFLGVSNSAELKLIVKSTNSAKELFTGYATTAASTQYRASFQCEIPTYWRWIAHPYYTEIIINTTVIEGAGAPPSLPQTQTFWLTSAHSNHTAVMTYLPQHEQHVWFIMNQDGSKNVSADIQIAFKSPILGIFPLILLLLGIIFVVIGIYLLRRKK